jgi:hypothetical protein
LVAFDSVDAPHIQYNRDLISVELSSGSLPCLSITDRKEEVFGSWADLDRVQTSEVINSSRAVAFIVL